MIQRYSYNLVYFLISVSIPCAWAKSASPIEFTFNSAGPFNTAMDQTCNADKSRSQVNSLPTNPTGGTGTKAKAQGLALEMSSRSALGTLQHKLGSSNAARENVRTILEANHCDASAVDTIAMKDWAGNSEASASSYAWNATLGSLYGIAKSGLTGPVDYSTIFDAQGKGLQLDPAEQLAIDERWKDAAFGSGCAAVMRRVADICSGKISARTLFEQQMSGVDPTLADMFTGGAKLGIKESAREVHAYKAELIRTENSEYRAENARLAADNDLQNRVIEKVQATDSSTDHYSDITGKAVSKEDVVKSAENKIAENNKTIDSNNKKIETNIKELKNQHDPNATDTVEKEQPKKPDKEFAEELAFDRFLESNWKSFQNKSAADYKTCTKDVNSPTVEVMEGYVPENPGGETCQFDKAIGSLIAISQAPSDQDPMTYEAGPDRAKENIERIRNGMPPCYGNPDVDLDACEAETDKYLRQNHVDGGINELCVIDPVSEPCTYKKTKAMFDESMAKKDDGPPVSINLDLSKSSTELAADVQKLVEQQKKKNDDLVVSVPVPKYDFWAESPHQQYCKKHLFEADCKDQLQIFLKVWLKK